jgi:aldehyde reductase
VLTAYSPFASPDRPWADPKDPKLLEDPALLKIAIKHKKSVAQVLLRYQVFNGYNFVIKSFYYLVLTHPKVDMGHVVIPKSVSAERITQNMDVFDFKLTPEDMTAIELLNRPDGRVVRMAL